MAVGRMMAMRTNMVRTYLGKMTQAELRDLMLEIVESLDEQQFKVVMDAVLTELNRRHPKNHGD